MALVSQTTIKKDVHGNILRARGTVRAAAILTNSYVAASEFDLSRFREFVVFFDVTQGSLTSVEYKIEQSYDGGSTWFNIGAESVTLATITEGLPEYKRTLSTDEKWFKVFQAVGDQVRVSIKGTGTATASSATIVIVGRG